MIKKPKWIRTRWPEPEVFNKVQDILRENNINTVCISARCPNIGECFSNKNLTFMILSDICTRRCRFCSVKKGIPPPPDPFEIERIIQTVDLLELSYVIITSVTRDDLVFFGADVFCDLVNRLKDKNPFIKIEILTPDFFGEVYQGLLDTGPYIWAHNIETVPRLYEEVRPQADYKRSLRLLESIKLKRNDILTKSGIMLGLGEEKDEVLEVFNDLKSAVVDIVTIGQYLKSSEDCIDVKRFVTPEEFLWYKEKAEALGFKEVLSGPLVRSSYRKETLNN